MVGLAAPAAGHGTDHKRAFQSKLAGTVVFVPAPPRAKCTAPPVQTRSKGWGTATHMGRVKMRAAHCAGNDVKGVMKLKSKHGSLRLRYAASCTPVPPFPKVVRCLGRYKIVDGWGRFDDARGRGVIKARIYPPQNVPDPLTEVWHARWLLRGWISY